MLDLSTLSAKRLNAEIEKRSARHSALLNATIAAGYGETRYNEIVALAKEHGNPLLVNYVTAWDAYHAALDEMDRRKRWHGSEKPIKRNN